MKTKNILAAFNPESCEAYSVPKSEKTKGNKMLKTFTQSVMIYLNFLLKIAKT